MFIPKFLKKPDQVINNVEIPIHSFLFSQTGNIDPKTVDSFGEEWKKFHSFDRQEIEKIGSDYFDILPESLKNKQVSVLDVGCGSGRWAAYVAPFVGHIDCIDPSIAVYSASKLLKDYENVRISRVDLDNLPFPDDSYDLVYSLGVLHHIPDTALAMRKCVEKVKPGGYFLVYLYYKLDNRGIIFKSIFQMSAVLRKMISKSPAGIKKLVCDGIAVLAYWPLARTARLAHKFGLKNLSKKMPLSYYQDKSFWIMKNDALDRFGTPLEQRFSRTEIEQMMKNSGLTNIKFSEKEPYWHAIGQKL